MFDSFDDIKSLEDPLARLIFIGETLDIQASSPIKLYKEIVKFLNKPQLADDEMAQRLFIYANTSRDDIKDNTPDILERPFINNGKSYDRVQDPTALNKSPFSRGRNIAPRYSR